MKSGHYFVTGTDTGVGKTVVSTILAIGMKARYWKPIQTGTRDETDSQSVGKWIGQDRIRPEAYKFPDPVSPHLAAQMQNREIDLHDCVKAFRSFHQPTIVEGAGGVLVPINSSFLMADFMGHLKIPTIVVSSTRLGTINHTLMTLEALRARDIELSGVVMVGNLNLETSASIEKFGNIDILGNVPQCDAFTYSWFLNAYNQLVPANHSGGNNVQQHESSASKNSEQSRSARQMAEYSFIS